MRGSKDRALDRAGRGAAAFGADNDLIDNGPSDPTTSGRQARKSLACYVPGGSLLLPALTALAFLVPTAPSAQATFVPATASSGDCPNASLRTGLSTNLPDCRAYEQVSPSDKGGYAAYPLIFSATPAVVSPSGEQIGYLTYGAFPGAAGNTALNAGHVSERTADGWGTTELTPAVPKAETLKISKADYSFSEDLSQTVLQVPIMQLTPGATPYAMNLYLRHHDGSLTLVNSAKPAVPVEAMCELGELAACWESEDKSTYAGATNDMRHILFESTAQLTGAAPPTGTSSLYENDEGTVRLVGYLPDGSPANGSTAGAESSVGYVTGEPTADRRVEHAISADGSRVIFQAPADEGEPEPAQNGLTEVYDRLNGAETVELSAPAPGATPKVGTPEPATFWAASEDGSRVFFTSSAELTTGSNTGSANNGEDLYEYDLTASALRDLTIDTSVADESTGAMVQGVVGASSDGAYVYFVANGELVAGKGIDGQPNLYVVHNGGSPTFIATLDPSSDATDWTPFPIPLTAYVTPDGGHMAFMSKMSLPTVNFPSGASNLDQGTETADSVVYEYSAGESEAAGQLTCASCSPSGARPVGDAVLGGTIQFLEPFLKNLQYRSTNTPFSKARAVSDNGSRVFFTARASASVTYDRVFEYERAGEGSCAGPPGCQYLLSDAGGLEDEIFLGASSTGSDVFIATSSSLLPGDQDRLRDIYDVRADGGILSSPGGLACESNCHTSTASPVGQTALGSAGVGPSGNLSPPRPTTAKCARGFTRVHGRCVKKCRGNRRRVHGRCVNTKNNAKARKSTARSHNKGRIR